MKKQISLCVLLSLCLLVGARPVRGEEQSKGGQALLTKPAVTSRSAVADANCPASQAVPSNVFSYGKTGQSHIKSLGQIGTTARYEIVSVKVRGLDTPNVAGFLIYDSKSDSFVGMQTAGAPGLGVALINGGASVAGSYLFGSKIQPDQSVNANFNSAENENQATATATATGASKPPKKP